MKKGLYGKIIPFLIAALVLTGFSAYGAVDTEGTYTLFGVKSEGYTVRNEVAGANSVLVLTADGKGSMTMDDETMGVSEWKTAEKTAEMIDGNAADSVISIVMEDGSSCDCAVRSGILEMDIMGTGATLLLYAKEGADYSAYPLMTEEELLAKMKEDQYKVPESDTRLYQLWKSMDPEAGIHMVYEKKPGYMNAVKTIDVQGKGKRYYSSETTVYGSYSSNKVVYVEDGKVYNLYPEGKTADLVTEIYSESVRDRIILMDDIYMAIFKKLKQGGGTTGTREINGSVYAAEIFPATEYEPEAAFCFTEDGRLVYYIEGAPVYGGYADLGETLYTIRSIDGSLNESLFDISGYRIK